MTELGEFAMYAAMGATSIAALVVISPIFKALANRIVGTKGLDETFPVLEARVSALEDRGLVSGEVESQYLRITELEDRLDFAERMLAERSETAPLPRETLS